MILSEVELGEANRSEAKLDEVNYSTAYINI